MEENKKPENPMAFPSDAYENIKEGMTLMELHQKNLSNSNSGSININKYVGGYYLGGKMGIGIMLKKKPNILRRYFMRLLLGWEWINN